MAYTKKEFGSDLFFLLGFLESAIKIHNSKGQHTISMARFKQFNDYCHKRFAKNGKITG